MQFLLVLMACARIPPATLVPDREPLAVTEDGWTLPLRHYAGDGPPVLLLHGMGVNHNHFDWREDVSLAHWLRAQGWDVWVTTLRGDPGTTPPSRKAARSWTFADHIRLDLPAVLDAVRAETGEEAVAGVGHSMGGMLLYGALGTYPERFSAAVSMCAPVTFREDAPLYRAARKTAFLVPRKGRAPVRALVVPSVRSAGERSFVARTLGNPENLDRDVAIGLFVTGAMPVPWAVAQEALTWLRTRQLVDADGAPWARPADVPILVVGAVADQLVPWQNVEAACELYPDCRFELLARSTGYSVDYGHADTVIGRTSATEVYPLVDAFLAEHLRPPADAVAGPVEASPSAEPAAPPGAGAGALPVP